MKKTYLVRCTAFLCILALFLGALSLVFYPKIRDWTHGLPNARIWMFQSEPRDSLDILAIGDSLLMCGYSPLNLWQETGYTGFNDCTGNQALTLSLRMLEAFCRSQSPKVVLLEADALYQPIDSDRILEDRILPKLPVLEYHDNWKLFSPKDFLRLPAYTASDPCKGTHFLYNRDREVPENACSYMEDRGETAPIDKNVLTYFHRIARLCERENIRLVLVSVPSPSLWSLARHQAVRDLADRYGLTYLDMNTMPEEVPIDWTTDKSPEGDHLNYLGTRKVTHYLGTWLQSTGLLTDRRGSALAPQWDALAADLEKTSREALTALAQEEAS